MSYTSCLFHIVINTYCRKSTICKEHRDDLYRFIWKEIQLKDCKLLRIGGIENHIHLLVDLHPTISLSDFVGAIKRDSSRWMKQTGLFPLFEGWGKEYFAFAKSIEHKSIIINYIINQEEHHKRISFEDELKQFFLEIGAEWKDYYLT